MKSFAINSLPLNEVLHDLSECLGTKCIKNCNEYSIKIPADWGSGYIRGTIFNGGIGLIQYQCKFKKELEIRFVVNKIHPVKFLYCLRGKLEHRFENSRTVNSLTKYQNAIVASKGKNGHVLRFAANITTDLSSLEITRKEFKREMFCYLHKSSESIKHLFKDETAKNSFYYEGLYSLQVSNYFEEMSAFGHKNLIKHLFMQAKALQILIGQLIQYEDDLAEKDERRILRNSEVRSIDEAVKIIELELENLEPVLSLAHRVGLNQNKLQDGFHILYSLSVNAYIQKERLKLAVSLLKNTNITMVEIMERLGLSSQSYFSKIFRDRYDITPSHYRKLHRAKPA
ncbi:AraC family transcriptional regulator [Aequorivita sp. SDUM287046]|uniref:AraC family transcriptional regulator n=1 Tax=Aequorivita aurantiaca TaxID=3053356 RepID=A0ABT8DLP6_9FLAO|nr:AraC family transcriptional regulator [Aequorivita aurantiaca]MDN3724148.1 AraC family transcriptional regulator [Aequorivita aurantiaca]